MIEGLADGLRLLAVPAFLFAAVSDWRYRAVPNYVWGIVGVLGVLALAVDGYAALNGGPTEPLTTAGIAVVVAVPSAFAAWSFGMMGGADAKAIMALALVLPVAPVALVAPAPHGIFALTVLVNGLILAQISTVRAGIRWVRGEKDIWANVEVPFMVPLAGGLLVAIGYGSVLFTVVTV